MQLHSSLRSITNVKKLIKSSFLFAFFVILCCQGCGQKRENADRLAAQGPTDEAAASTETVEPFAHERRAALWTDAWGGMRVDWTAVADWPTGDSPAAKAARRWIKQQSLPTHSGAGKRRDSAIKPTYTGAAFPYRTDLSSRKMDFGFTGETTPSTRHTPMKKAANFPPCSSTGILWTVFMTHHAVTLLQAIKRRP